MGPEHRPFAWVPQEAPLVTGTVATNVMLTGGDDGSSRGALESLGARSLLGIADGEIVGPGGRPLSGGERRLVSIARAVSSGLPVILLDEPTEGLDAASVSGVLEALSSLRGKRTMIVATHRDDVMALADRVVTIGAL
jgi:ABC-type transport system involved in cytochrome bd biosynthesis fused ATPase/permease subunit